MGGAPEGLAPSPAHLRPGWRRGALPFIHKLLEVLGEDAAGQLGRRLWERTDGWESDARGWFWNHGGKTPPSSSLVRTAQHFWGPQDAPVLVPSVRLAGGRGDPHPTPQQPPCGPCRQAVLCQSFPSKALVWESRCFCREGAQGSLGPQGRGWSLRLGHRLLRVSRQGQLVLGVGAESRGSSRRLAWHTPQSGGSRARPCQGGGGQRPCR